MIKELFSEKGGWNIEKKLLAFALALTMCLGSGMTANAAMIVKNNMSALNTLNTINKKHLFRDLSAQRNYEKVQNNIYPGSP